MDVELLVINGCPNTGSAHHALRQVLDELGRDDIRVRITTVDTPADAEQRGFIGSPTILINGDDPYAEPGRPPGLSCRVYSHATDENGIPSIASLREILRSAG